MAPALRRRQLPPRVGLVTNLLDDARVGGLVLTARDVNARKAFEEQLRHRAFHDPLTSLANRALFYDRIEHALAREQRAGGHARRAVPRPRRLQGGQRPLGHAVGDELLVAVAERLRSCARGADTVAGWAATSSGCCSSPSRARRAGPDRRADPHGAERAVRPAG